MKRFLVWLRNLSHWKTARAYRDLTRAMKTDDGFAEAWRANIAMGILDNCDRKLSHAEANSIADRLMFNLFEVRPKGRTL